MAVLTGPFRSVLIERNPQGVSLGNLPCALRFGGGSPVGHLAASHIGPRQRQRFGDARSCQPLQRPQGPVTGRWCGIEKGLKLISRHGRGLPIAIDLHCSPVDYHLTLVALLTKQQPPSQGAGSERRGPNGGEISPY